MNKDILLAIDQLTKAIAELSWASGGGPSDEYVENKLKDALGRILNAAEDIERAAEKLNPELHPGSKISLT